MSSNFKLVSNQEFFHNMEEVCAAYFTIVLKSATDDLQKIGMCSKSVTYATRALINIINGKE